MPKYEMRITMRAKPTPRPRVNRYGVAYYPAKYTKYKRELENAFEGKNIKLKTKDKPLALQIFCWYKRAKGSKLLYPVGDADNIIKGVMDSMKCIIGDDKRVVVLFFGKKYCEPNKGDIDQDVIDIIIEEDE